MPRRLPAAALIALLSVLPIVAGQSAPPGTSGAGMQEWPVYGGDPNGTKYSPLADITRDNVQRLQSAWEWRTNEKALEQFGTRPGAFQNTPLMIDNVLYVSTPYNRVVALDAETGRELWSFDPKPYEDGQPPNGTGFVHRGLATWRDGQHLRIFINSRYRLIALDAKTGQTIRAFGEDGVVDLTKGLLWTINKRHYTNTSPPIVYKDLIILGNGVGDRLVYTNDPPGDVRAFDVRTGRIVWTFHTIPQPGEYGNDTWGNGAWKVTGHTNVWAPMTLDAERGLVYLPLTTPSNDFFGGRRPGANLFAESLVCLDAGTGKRVWHFQIVHHGLWDYDLPSPPSLVTISPNGKKLDAVVALTKQGFAFVFDRVTGTPVWPIEERPVPPSDVPGEHAWPTQPFPTRPPAFTEQGVSLEDAFDLTPELKAAAQEEMKKYRIGPLYTPPSLQGTLQRPGLIGGANWGGAAFDPETGVLYVKTSNLANIGRVGPPDRSASNPRASEVDAELARVGNTNAEFRPPAPSGASPSLAQGVASVAQGGGAAVAQSFSSAREAEPLPLLKPPYGHVVAIDLNKGDIAWRVPFGDSPTLRQHPLLKGVKLPDRLGTSGAPGVLLTKGGLLFVGGADDAFTALDKSNGRDLWRVPLPRRTSGTPMTYRSRSGRQFVVIATGGGEDAVLMAFALPASPPSALRRRVTSGGRSKPRML